MHVQAVKEGSLTVESRGGDIHIGSMAGATAELLSGGRLSIIRCQCLSSSAVELQICATKMCRIGARCSSTSAECGLLCRRRRDWQRHCGEGVCAYRPG